MSGEHDFLPVAPLIKAGNMGTAPAALDRKAIAAGRPAEVERGGIRNGPVYACFRNIAGLAWQ
jgi:hypothetical protein